MPELSEETPRRRFHRIDRPCFAAELGGRRAVTKDWSWGGVALRIDDGAPFDLRPDQMVTGRIGWPQSPEGCVIRGRVVRVDPRSRTVALELADLGEEVFQLFETALRAHLPPREERVETEAPAPVADILPDRRRAVG